MSKDIHKILKTGIGALAIGCILWGGSRQCNMDVSAIVQMFTDKILSFGPYAPIAYIIIFTLVPLTLFPDALLAVAGGAIFGLKWGFVLTMIGALCGGTLSFGLSRWLGREVIHRWIKHDLTELEKRIEDQGFLIVLGLRLIPLLPFDVISYGAGLTSIKYRDFVLATILGTIPGIFAYVNIGDKAIGGTKNEIYMALAVLVVLAVITWMAKERYKNSKTQVKADPQKQL